MTRKIIHVDMDAFYASVEQRDNPALQGRPVIVGGAADQRGVVAAASYEARAVGIHSAMPSSRAARLCPDAVFIRPRFDVYRAVSQQIRAIFHSYTWLVEPLSLDEAYLDVSDVRQHKGSATRIAQAIRKTIYERTHLTASAGVSYNKLLAKLASDMDKPDGLTVITPEHASSVMQDMPAKRLPGIGPATAKKLERLNIYSCADLAACGDSELAQVLGRTASRFQQMALGIDERPVSPYRVAQSIGAETTFVCDLRALPELLEALSALTTKVAERLQKKRMRGTSVTLKVKYADFELITRSRSLDVGIDDAASLRSLLPGLLARTDAGKRPIRLLGLTVSRLQAQEPRPAQSSLFGSQAL